MKRSVSEVIKALQSDPGAFWGQCRMLRLYEDSVFCLEDGDVLLDEVLPDGVDVDCAFNVKGELVLVTTGNSGDVGKQLIQACRFGANVPYYKRWPCGADAFETFCVTSSTGTVELDATGLRSAKVVFDNDGQPYLFGFKAGEEGSRPAVFPPRVRSGGWSLGFDQKDRRQRTAKSLIKKWLRPFSP